MEIANIISAVLAGGLAGQITSVLLTQRLQGRREKDAWLRDARLRAFTELLENTSSYATRREFDTWPTEIRVLCQKALLLCPGGEAPGPLADAMQRSFILALHRKQERVKDPKKWRDEFRSTTSILRREMAILIHGSGPLASTFGSSNHMDELEEDASVSVGGATGSAIAAVEPAP